MRFSHKAVELYHWELLQLIIDLHDQLALVQAWATDHFLKQEHLTLSSTFSQPSGKATSSGLSPLHFQSNVSWLKIKCCCPAYASFHCMPTSFVKLVAVHCGRIFSFPPFWSLFGDKFPSRTVKGGLFFNLQRTEWNIYGSVFAIWGGKGPNSLMKQWKDLLAFVLTKLEMEEWSNGFCFVYKKM